MVEEEGGSEKSLVCTREREKRVTRRESLINGFEKGQLSDEFVEIQPRRGNGYTSSQMSNHI